MRIMPSSFPPRHPGRTILPAAFALTVLLSGFSLLHSTGMFDRTRKSTDPGCTCHGGLPVDSVLVRIEGPPSVAPGSAHSYRLVMTGGPAIAGGLDVAAGRGTLAVADSLTQILFGEITHTEPKFFSSDTVSWNFSYLAPNDTGRDTLFGVANSVNYNFDPLGDMYNFSPDFILEVRIDTLTSAPEPQRPRGFHLEQNYPNPFNPSTTIRYAIGRAAEVRLEIFDIGGGRAALLVDRRQGPGEYAVSWDAGGVPGGVYFYRLSSGGGSVTRKMLLLK
jgi:hypothetical protein